MARKLTDIRNLLDSSGPRFYKYLHDLIQDDIINKLDDLTLKTDVYLFSGIIRNYFLHIYLKRDIDVVIGENVNIDEEFKGLPITRNSFGGYKIKYPTTPLDIWHIKDTWGFHYPQKSLELELDKKIPDTAFFNFSAIVFSLNKRKFYYTDDFVKFLRNKDLDYVYKFNANYPLCVVNTLYYSDKYHLKISDRLMKYIKEIHKRHHHSYNQIQIKHFGEIYYTDEDIETRLT